MKLTNEKKRETFGGLHAPILENSQLHSRQYSGSVEVTIILIIIVKRNFNWILDV
jgi:hypothetical protein